MMPSRVRQAVVIAIVCHGLFILSGRYHLSYDAYTHMLFANHYAEDWFSLWETRWYTGFTVISYPPLTHQLIALFIPFLGFDKAFALLLWLVTASYPLGIYAFSRIFTGRASASYAALASAVLLPIYVTAHIFGQLPFLTSTLAALFAAASLNRYLRDGGLHNFALSTTLIATSMAMHHATLMVQPFLIFAVAINRLPGTRGSTRLGWVLLRRLFLFSLASIIAGLLVIFPFWQWGVTQTLQKPIDHLSRHNFFTDPLAAAIFFFPLYGLFVALIPFLVRKWPMHLRGLLVSFIVLFVLGLGGTTPLPRILLGNAWEWLTYDRFAFWACLTLTPFFGIFLIRLTRRWRNGLSTKPVPAKSRKRLVPGLVFFLLAFTSLGSWFTPFLWRVQPNPIAMQPVVAFLESGNHSQWRYLTLGFGDQFAYLNLLTSATTLDGSYHTARTLPELRASGIGQVDTAYWALNGIAAIKPILERSGEHSVRWVFVNPDTREAVKTRRGIIHQSPFVPLLAELGWKRIKTLDNGIWVYENPAAMPLRADPAPGFPPSASFAWGVFPMLTFVTASAFGTLRVYPTQAEWVIRKIYAFAIGLLPLALCFWVYRIVGEFSHPRVYFTYDNALFFLSDALVVLAVILWITVKISHSPNKAKMPTGRWSPLVLFSFAFLLLTTASSLWSRDWRISLYFSLHLWLIFCLVLSLRDWQEVWPIAVFGLCCALSFEIVAGFVGFGLQTTAFLSPLELEWPGTLTPLLPGASVVQLASGLRILRAYGTLPHPNFLGGVVLFTLLGPVYLFLIRREPNYAVLLLLVLGIILLVLTFSRSAWLGLLAFAMILVAKAKYFERYRITLLISVVVLAGICSLYPLRDLLLTRIASQGIATEEISTQGRSWLSAQAEEMIQTSPVIGVGVGSFLLELAKQAPRGAPIEPVHNLPLLIAAELGLAGLALALFLCAALAIKMLQSKAPESILAGALIAGLGIISLFDHYLWTVAPGRIMLGLALGLWAGQAARHA